MGRNCGGPEGTRITMFHIGRCGSTVLGNMLDEEPTLFWDSEALDPRIDRVHRMPELLERERFDRKAFDREVRRRFVNAGKRRYGVEFKHEQINLYGIRDPNEARDILKSAGFGVFVSLIRKNVLRQLVSTLRGIAIGNMHINAGDKKGLNMKPIDLDPAGFRVRNGQKIEPLEAHLDRRERSLEWLKEAAGDDALHLEFETHVLKDPRVGYELLCKHIGIEARDQAPSLTRTNPQPVDQLLADPKAWRDRLKGTRFEWMMDAE